VKPIVIATDGSDEAKEAVRLGVELAADEGAEVVLAHVVQVFDPLERAPGSPHRVPAAADDEALREASAIAEAAGVPATLELLLGLPEDEIVALADDLDASVVVVGSRGQSGLRGALLGSVSRAVVKNAKRPVLVVKPTSAPTLVAQAG
jgi:nucleotide-binding universal stress UspA family protein